MTFGSKIKKGEASPAKPLNKMKVLFVENDLDKAGKYQRFFEFAGINKDNITIASSADEAIKAMGKQKFDLVITDFNLGKGKPTGEEVLKEARSRGISKYYTLQG